jgi:hypothetical protein
VIDYQPQRDLTMNLRKTKYTIFGYANGQLLDVTEVKGIVAARNISSFWESTGRFTEVTFKPKNQLLV